MTEKCLDLGKNSFILQGRSGFFSIFLFFFKNENNGVFRSGEGVGVLGNGGLDRVLSSSD